MKRFRRRVPDQEASMLDMETKGKASMCHLNVISKVSPIKA